MLERQEAINVLLVQNLAIDQIQAEANRAIQLGDTARLQQVFAAADRMGL